MKIFQVRVSQSLFNWNSIFRIEDQHFWNKIKSLLVHLRKKCREWTFLDISNLIDALLSHDGLHRLHFISSGFSQKLKDTFYLIQSGISWENSLSEIHFSQNASNWPHINSFSVLWRAKQNFRSPIPTSGHILSHDRFLDRLVDSCDRTG